MSDPDFFLASTEGIRLEAPRRCYRLRRIAGRGGDDYLLIRIVPPIIGQPYGLGVGDIDRVILATRHEGASPSSRRFVARECPCREAHPRTPGWGHPGTG